MSSTEHNRYHDLVRVFEFGIGLVAIIASSGDVGLIIFGCAAMGDAFWLQFVPNIFAGKPNDASKSN